MDSSTTKKTDLPNLAWIDIETTGLDEQTELPLEIGLVITDANLNILHEEVYVIRQTLILNDLSEWVLETHSANGLLKEVVSSWYDSDEVDRCLAATLRRSDYFPDADQKPPLCGSTVAFDRAWLKQWFPRTLKALHYRNIDVSSIKELMQRWMPEEAISNKETSKHRSLPDIHDSIAELQHYRNTLWLAADLAAIAS